VVHRGSERRVTRRVGLRRAPSHAFGGHNPNYSKSYFEDVFVPLGPWKENMSEKDVFVSNLMREDIARVFPAFKRRLLGDGQEERFIDRMIEETAKELRDIEKHSYHRFTFVAAVRGHEPWQPRLERHEPEDAYSQSIIAGFTPTQSNAGSAGSAAERPLDAMEAMSRIANLARRPGETVDSMSGASHLGVASETESSCMTPATR